MSSTPYVFLSHTGRDGVKGIIARPTHWFLEKVLEVSAFLMRQVRSAGDPKMEALLPAAYKCTHAVVILSPTFRQREFCVRELNTFMARLRREENGIKVIPTLWLLDTLAGYHRDVDDLIRIGHGKTLSPSVYMLHYLWPGLLRSLGHHEMSSDVLEEHLMKYIDSHREIHGTPAELEHFFQYAMTRRRVHMAAVVPRGPEHMRILVYSEDHFIGTTIMNAVNTEREARCAEWVNRLEDIPRSTLRSSFPYDAICVDIRNNWPAKREFIQGIRRRYPIVPFVLVGIRKTFLTSLVDSEFDKYSGYFFLDVNTPLSQVPAVLEDVMCMVEMDILNEYGIR